MNEAGGDDIAVAAQIACLLEVSSPKPGNVGPGRDFADAGFQDFLLSAAAIGPALARAGEVGVGRAVLGAIKATRRWVTTNTNLGIVLLLAPLARGAVQGSGRPSPRRTSSRPAPLAGAEVHGPRPLRDRLAGVLADLTVEDAEATYEAIRLAEPGGLGHSTAQDIQSSPTVTLREAMALAADRDTIAREYVTDYVVTFETAVPALREARRRGLPWPAAVLDAYLEVLAAVPDTLIARKAGREAAEAVSREAARVLASDRAGGDARQRALAAFDQHLRGPSNRLNPGTTADLTAAAVFVVLLETDLGSA